jgi:hypothetical protein
MQAAIWEGRKATGVEFPADHTKPKMILCPTRKEQSRGDFHFASLGGYAFVKLGINMVPLFDQVSVRRKRHNHTLETAADVHQHPSLTRSRWLDMCTQQQFKHHVDGLPTNAVNVGCTFT